MIFKKGSVYRLLKDSSMLARLISSREHWLTVKANDILLFLFEEVIDGAYTGSYPNSEPVFVVYFLVGEFMISMPKSIAEDALIEING